MIFNEDSRVKIPALIHFTRLGYQYLSLKGETWDASSNIFSSIFKESVQRLNPDIPTDDLDRLLQELLLTLDNEDLGKAFYERLCKSSKVKLIDFDNFENNQLNVVTELSCKSDDEEFRPDITLLINGMPLAFIEVKKPNNRDGILAERNRIKTRFENPKFRRFVNITQVVMFSNNMEYDDNATEPIEGAFYSGTAYGLPAFNYFREELKDELPSLLEIDPQTENFILKDNNLHSIKHSEEYETNKDASSPTNRLSTSLFSPTRLSFLIQYGIAYLKGTDGPEKHIMRYPQIFATKAIQRKLEQGKKKGIIWHTQGSGKTALAFYNVHYLSDYFQSKGTISKFYFIVDRLDLLIQAAREFRHRGLVVHEVNSREAFAKDIKSSSAIHNHQGNLEITVVNIQKFQDDPNVVHQSDYDIQLQRVYFLDEVHRSYNPKGSFLANLHESDPNAIKIGLTGTPLLGNDYNSKALFGNYIHKYYYNASIKDGYTLRLIREDIETGYKMQLAKTLEEIEVLKGKSNRKEVYAHEQFVEPMLNYIISDFEKARIEHNDSSIGAMVICDSSEQAKEMVRIFDERQTAQAQVNDNTIPYAVADNELPLVAEEQNDYNQNSKRRKQKRVKTTALILHDVGTKQSRKDQIEAFKEGKIDMLFVYNMLLTGFDAHRLKKLYLGRVIKDHNLLQALTRVNRTYREFRYGYVVDFADIQKEFDKTNKAYFDELQNELGDELENYSNLFKSPEEIETDIEQIKNTLWQFDTQNAEVFSQQVSQIQDRKQMLEIVKALQMARELSNVIRLSGQYDLLERLDFKKLNQLGTEARNHLTLLNQKIALEDGHDNTNILNVALEDVIFTFRKVGESELKIADELRQTLRKTREMLGGNFDPLDPEFVSLKEELERLFKKKNLSEISQDEMADNIGVLNKIQAKARELERKNQLLKAKYENDAKYARLHKRLMEKFPLDSRERKLFEALSDFKQKADEKIFQNAELLNNESYAEREMLRLAIEHLNQKHELGFDRTSINAINSLIMKEYLNEFHGKVPHDTNTTLRIKSQNTYR